MTPRFFLLGSFTMWHSLPPMMLPFLTCMCVIMQPLSANDETTRLSVAEINGQKCVQASGFDDLQWKTLEQQSKESSEKFAPIQLFVAPLPDSVSKQTASDPKQPAVFGSCQLNPKARSVIFTPRYALLDGIRYIAELRVSNDKTISTMEVFNEKVLSKPTAKVNTIYPTADVLPENLLKFYVHFSAPMSSGDAYRHIELVSDDGKQLMHPFLEIAEELWDPSGQRLTLLLDPARVKRGLVPHEEDGAILFAGKKYHLTIKRDWLDANGTPMIADYKKTFSVAASDYTQPNVAFWRIAKPRANTRDQLVIDLHEPLDHAIVTRGIRVYDSHNQWVEGKVSLSKLERVWSLTPTNAWSSGEYSVRINERIEDLVGNSIAKPFEVDRFDRIEPLTPRHIELRFTVVD